MTKYNFRKFFNTGYRIANDEYVSNGHFIIKREMLTKAQNNFVNDFQEDDRIDFIIKTFRECIDKEYIYNTIEFIPKAITDFKNIRDYQIIIDKDNYAVREEYYNFFKSKKCRIVKVEGELSKPAYIYNNDNAVVGIVLPVRLTPSQIKKVIPYNESVS